MKVCEVHIKTSGLKKRQLEIVDSSECELCRLDNYFNDPKNPVRKTEHEVIMLRRGRK